LRPSLFDSGYERVRRNAVLLGLPDFEVLSAGTVEEACSLLSRYGEDAQFFAGGTDLFVKMKHRKTIPKYLINIKRIAGLDQIRYQRGDGLRLGALATIQAIADSEIVAKKYPVLSQAAGMLGTTQIRNLGTIGGNLANASPSAEFAPGLLTLDAQIRCVGGGGERIIPIEEFFLSPGKSALRQDEMIIEVHAPDLPDSARGTYLKHSLRKMDVSMAGAALIVFLEGDECRDVRIALGAVAPTPFRARVAEKILRGRKLAGDETEGDLLDEVAQAASGESRPIDDIRGYARYRKEIVTRMIRRGLEHLVATARA
jgi:CO/xanthine dehydrogenase FAD-binding subunit